MLNRLVSSWVYGGFLAGLLILLLAPLLLAGRRPVLVAAFFCLPVYMFHQYEEHDNDRFRRFVNRVVGGGREVLTPLEVFLVNVPGVWGVLALSLWLAAGIEPGFALISAYLLLVNSAVHIAQGILAREYNPGLASAVLLLLPAGCWCMIAVQHSGTGTAAMHVTGLASAVALHLATVIPVLRNRRKYSSPGQAVPISRTT